MDDEALRAGPLEGRAAGGGMRDVGALNLEVGAAAVVSRVDGGGGRGDHDDVRPAEILVRLHGWRSCTSRSALQAR